MTSKNTRLYDIYVTCSGPCEKWVPRSSLKEGQISCSVCHLKFRTGPKNKRLKIPYDEGLTRY